MCVMTFVACGDDSDDVNKGGDTPTEEATQMDLTITMPLTADFLKWTDTQISYLDAQGNEVVESLTAENTTNNVWTKKVSGLAFPGQVKMAINFKAKNAEAIGKTVTIPANVNLLYQPKSAKGNNVGTSYEYKTNEQSFGTVALDNIRGHVVNVKLNVAGAGNVTISHFDYSAPVLSTVSFEYQTLNDLGFWAGEENENGKDDGYGMTYPCVYKEGYATFNISYSGYYWGGYAISNRPGTGFTEGASVTPTETPDQFNNVTGKAHSGNNFCVVCPSYSGDMTIDLNNVKGNRFEFIVKSLYFTNSSYTAEVIKNGNGYGKKFEAADWLKCIITGTHADGTTATVELDLAKGTTYVNTWEKADLSSLGKVTSLSFSFDGSDKSYGYLNTPTYLCIDDMEVEPVVKTE